MTRLPIKPLLVGLSSYTPIFNLKSGYQKHGTGGTSLARYCYSVWLRHLVVLFENGLTEIPNTVAELGPGDSIGVGIAALLSGSNHYNAFDVVEYTSQSRNITILNEIIELFKNKTNIPDDTEFPNVKPKLKSYEFPIQILKNNITQSSLAESRIVAIRNAVINYGQHDSISIKYCAPWFNSRSMNDSSVDLIYSQAVLEHVDDLYMAYDSMFKWLSPSGFMSHQIDFKSHGTANCWNGHWAYSDLVWMLIKGKRPYLLNREPLSSHVKLQTGIGFKIKAINRVYGDHNSEGIKRSNLSKRFSSLSDEDFATSSAHLVSIKQ